MTQQLKISLPFNQACKLNDDQKCKLIVCQARRLSIQEWEIESLLSICKSKGWIDKGLAVLYEYAGYVDDIKTMVEMYTDLCCCIQDEVELLRSVNEVDIDKLSVLLKKCGAMTAKLIYTVCIWRRLQACPRPVIFEDFNIIDSKISLQSILRENSGNLFNALLPLQEHIKRLLEGNQMAILHLVLIFGPSLSYKDFINFLLGKQQRLSNPIEESDAISSFDPLTLVNSQHEVLYNGLNEILQVEDRIEGTWKKLNFSLSSNLFESKPLCDSFASLRLPYKNYKAPSDDLVWFADAITKYTTTGNSLLPISKTAESVGSPTNLNNKYYKLRLESNRVQRDRRPLVLLSAAPVIFTRKELPKDSNKKKSSGKYHEDDELRNIVSNDAGSPTSMGNDDDDEEEDVRSRASPSLTSFGGLSKSMDPHDRSEGIVTPRTASKCNVLPEVIISPRVVATPLSTPSKTSTSKRNVPTGKKTIDNSKSHDVLPSMGSKGSNRSTSSPIPALSRENSSSKLVPGSSSSANESVSVIASKPPSVNQETASTPIKLQPITNNFMQEGFVSPLTADSRKFFSPMAMNSPNFANGQFSPEQVKYYQQLQMQQMDFQQQLYRQQQILAYQQAQAQLAQQQATVGASPILAQQQALIQAQLQQLQVQYPPSQLQSIEQNTSPLKSSNNAADLVPMTPDSTQRKRSVTIALAKQNESPAKGVDEHRRVTVSGPMSLDAFQAQLRKAKEDEELRKARVGKIGLAADVLPSAMKKVTPDSSRPVSGRGSNSTPVMEEPNSKPVVEAKKESEIKKEPSPPTIQERPSQMLKHRESYNSIGANSDAEGEDQIIYRANSNDPNVMQNNSPFTPTSQPSHHPLVRAQSGGEGYYTLDQPPPNYMFSPGGYSTTSGSEFTYYDSQASSAYRGRVQSADAVIMRREQRLPISHRKSAPTKRKRTKSPVKAKLKPSGFTHVQQHGDLLRPKVDFLYSAFLEIEKKGGSIIHISACKMQIWWRILAPRLKLIKRIAIRETVLSVLWDLVDSSISLGIQRQRKRRSLLRYGAAIKIQRKFRYWVSTVLAEEKRFQMEERVRMAWVRLLLWCRATCVGIRIYRYMKWVMRKRPKPVEKKTTKKNIRPHAAVRKITQKYIQMLTLHNKIQLHNQLIAKHHAELAEHERHGHNNVKRHRVVQEREQAVVIIQKYYRRYVVRKHFLNRKVLNVMRNRIMLFFIRGIAIRRLRRKRLLNAAAITIQTFFRGIHTRKKIYKLVSCGLKLNAMWRKHRAYRSLKSQLRRVDRPHTIVVHGMRNIAKKFVSNDTLRFKLSVWWNPLLHIVSQNDFDTIIQSKSPQFIYNGFSHPVVDEDTASQIDQKFAFSRSVKSMSKPSTSLPPSMADNSSIKSSHTNASHNQSAIIAHSSSQSPNTKDPQAARQQLQDAFAHMPTAPVRSLKDSFSEIAGKSTSVEGSGNATSSPMKPSALASIDLDEENEDDDDGANDSNHTPIGNGNYTYGIPEESEVDFAPDGTMPVPSKMRTKLNDSVLLSKSLNVNNEAAEKDNSQSQSQAHSHSHSHSHAHNSEKDKNKSRDEHNDDSSSLSSHNTQNTRNTNTNVNNQQHNHHHHDTFNSDPKQTTIKRPSIFKRTTASFAMVRQSINYALHLGQNHRGSIDANKNPKFLCNFEDETIKIPGCHGNSVFKFEILEGERKFGTVYFYLSKEGDMMYWGGEYTKEVSIIKQRRAIQFNSHIIATAKESFTPSQGNDAPTLEFRVIAGAPLRSRCQWGRMVVKGNGPLKRLLNSKDVMASFLFDKWHRFYFSIDEFTFDLYDNKFSTTPFFSYPVKDLKEMKVDTGAPIRQNKAASSKNIVEDITNVIVSTYSGDELYMRFQDSGSRVAWSEVLTKAIDFNKKTNITPKHQKHWLSAFVGGDEKDDDSHVNSPAPSPPKMKGSPKQEALMALAQQQRMQESGGLGVGLGVNSRARVAPIFNVPHASKVRGNSDNLMIEHK